MKKDSKLLDLLFGTQNILGLIPGLFCAVGLTLCSLYVTNFIGDAIAWKKNPLSPILVAILLGIILRSSLSLPSMFQPGISFGVKKLLRLGIILMGIRLSILTVLQIGVVAVGMIIICIGAALVCTMIIAKKIGVSDKLGTLIAAGTSICGVSAIVATSPTIQANEEETTYAVGTITIFGILATLCYPYITELLLKLSVSAAGFFIGTAVHDTSQATATALIYDQLWAKKTDMGLTCADIAITTKLVRNTFMIVIIPLLGLWYNKKSFQEKGSTTFKIGTYIPLFVMGYIVMGIVRSLGDYFFGIDHQSWVTTWHEIKGLATFLITVAIACVGLNTDIKKLTHLGYKPFLCGLIAAFSVGLVSWLLVVLFGRVLAF